MRLLPLLARTMLLVSIAASASAVTMAWTPIGNPGNACDPQLEECFGAVGYAYGIGTNEVTNGQYAEFLNAIASTDTNEIFEPILFSPLSGISRTGAPGSYSYSVNPGYETRAVNFIDFYDALRFANWMHNGQPTGAQGPNTTEDGAYTISQAGIDANTITRNPGAQIALPTENEWYKAAYYDALLAQYNPYPFADHANQANCELPPGTTSHSSNCAGVSGPQVAPVGSYPSSPSAFGTYDQGGNVAEWNETIIDGIDGSQRGVRGGGYIGPDPSAAAYREAYIPIYSSSSQGFRLVLIPEPSTGLLVIVGLMGFTVSRPQRG
jgi:formylglycine-generating enzyme required for sulfatase activity